MKRSSSPSGQVLIELLISLLLLANLLIFSYALFHDLQHASYQHMLTLGREN